MGFNSRYARVLNICTDPRYFGEPAQYLSKTSPPEVEPITIYGVPNREAIELFLGEGPVSKARKATFGVNLRNLQEEGISLKEGDLLSMRGIQFFIKEVDADGEGGATLVLSKR